MRRAALLLEVVVALTVLVAAMGLLGAQLVGGLELTRQSEQELRASLLSDRIVALVELDPNLQRRIAETPEGEELVDAFGPEYPGYFFGVTSEPVEQELQELHLITIRVLHQPSVEQPDSLDGVATMRTVALLKAAPGTIDLVSQAGLSEEQAEQLRQTIPIAGFDPHAVDLHQLVSLDPQALLEMLPALTALMGQLGTGGLTELLGQLGQDGLPSQLQGAGSPDDLANTIRQMAEAAGSEGLPRPPGQDGQGPPRPPNLQPPAGDGSGSRPPLPPGGRPGGQGPGRQGGRGQGGRGGQGGQDPRQPPVTEPQIDVGQGSGPNGEYTIEDLIRMRDEYERQQQGGR